MSDKLAQIKELARTCYENYAGLHDNITIAPLASTYDRQRQRYIRWHHNHHSLLYGLRGNDEILSVIECALSAASDTLREGKFLPSQDSNTAYNEIVLVLVSSSKSKDEAGNLDGDIQEFASDSAETLQTCNDVLSNMIPLSEGFKAQIHVKDRSARSKRVVEMFSLGRFTRETSNSLIQSRLGLRLARGLDARGTLTGI